MIRIEGPRSDLSQNLIRSQFSVYPVSFLNEGFDCYGRKLKNVKTVVEDYKEDYWLGLEYFRPTIAGAGPMKKALVC